MTDGADPKELWATWTGTTGQPNPESVATNKPADAERVAALRAWLAAQAADHGLTYLLAHAEDGVIWGRFTAAGLVTADTTITRPHFRLTQLRPTTLQQCRAFGAHAEALLWPSFQGWQARLVVEGTGDVPTIACWDSTKGVWSPSKALPNAIKQDDQFSGQIDEDQILWGTAGEESKDFTLLRDGAQGLCHAVPLAQIAFAEDGSESHDSRYRPVRLHVRHYLAFDDVGTARIALSRLVDLVVRQRQNDE